jgi:hypothetical protein
MSKTLEKNLTAEDAESAEKNMKLGIIFSKDIFSVLVKKFFILIFIFNLFSLYPDLIYQNYIQVYGEGPVGRYLLGKDVKVYTKDDAVNLAKDEIREFLAGMLYGYAFVYKVENKLNHSQGFFELTPLAKIKDLEKNVELTQFEESSVSLRFQALYRLKDDQKSFVNGFQSSLAKFSVGEARKNSIGEWNLRLEAYKDAMKNAVLNEARLKIKARPLFIKGRILLKNSPTITLISGDWRARVETHLIIQEVTYEDVY